MPNVNSTEQALSPDLMKTVLIVEDGLASGEALSLALKEMTAIRSSTSTMGLPKVGRTSPSIVFYLTISFPAWMIRNAWSSCEQTKRESRRL